MSIDCEEDGEYLIASTLISQCILHCHLNFGKDDLNSMLNQVYLKFKDGENEVKAEIVGFQLENPTDFVNEEGQCHIYNSFEYVLSMDIHNLNIFMNKK